MKILLDECLPVDFRHALGGHDVQTVQWAGFKGKSNGQLIEAAEIAGYQVLLTVDQGIPHQQRSSDRTLSIILLRPRTNQLEDLMPFVDSILAALDAIRLGEVMTISAPT